MITGAEKLKLVRELGVIRGNFPNSAGRNKLVLAKRIGEIRKLLLDVQGNNAADLVIDPADEVASLQAIDEYLAKGFKQLPEAIASSELDALERILSILPKSPDNKEIRDKLFWSVTGYPRKVDSISTMEHLKAAGDVFSIDVGYAESVAATIKELQSMPLIETPEIAEAKARWSELTAEAYKIRDARMALLTSPNLPDQNELDELGRKYSEIWEKVNSISGDYRELVADQNRERQANIDAAKAQLTVPGKRIIETLLNGSKVSQDQAEAWANAQVISKAAQNRLEKTGYPIADVRRDMAEFHRLSGGKLRGIAIDSKGGKRAQTNGIGSVESIVIWLDGRFNKTTLFHEMAHHLEADPAAKAASNGYLLKRRKSGAVFRLRQLTGNQGYRSDEVAYEDDFINHYIGKVYSDQTTEVWAMGVQYLATPEDAAMMLGRDPELAALMAGYLQADLTPGMKALQVLQDNKKDLNQVERETIKSEYQQAIETLAAGVEIVDDGWFDALGAAEKAAILGTEDYYYSRVGDKDAKFMGSWGFFRVFRGKFKNNSRRVAKGYSVCYENRWNLKDASVDYEKIVVPVFTAFHGDLESLKAALKIAKESFGGEFYQVTWRMFGKNAYAGEVIDQANKIRSAT